MPPISPAVMSERISPNMFSITITSKSQRTLDEQRRAGVDIEAVGLDAGMPRRRRVEHLAEKRERLEHVRLVDAGQRTQPAARLAPLRQPERKFEQPFRSLARDDQCLARFGIGDDPLPHRSKQAFGGFPD